MKTRNTHLQTLALALTLIGVTLNGQEAGWTQCASAQTAGAV
jgi:hypothetical protein